jgi:hypothetical protein
LRRWRPGPAQEAIENPIDDDEGQSPMRGRLLTLALMLTVPMVPAAAGFAEVPTDSRIVFARDTEVPQSVQEFARRVIETRCAYQSYERQQRSFWLTMRTRGRSMPLSSIQSALFRADVEAEPSAFIAMTIVANGRLQLTSLKSSFIVCELH